MGHKNKKTLIRQVQEKLDSKLAINHSRHEDKRSGADTERIYSWNTYKTYLKHACYFVKWCKAEHKCRTLEECRPYADAWLLARIGAGLSAYTVTMERAALGKLYGEPGENFAAVPQRHRSDIKRSRGKAERDRHFSEARHADIISFCRSTGLRRSELAIVTGDCFYTDDDGQARLLITRGTKGGRWRSVPVIGNVDLVRQLCSQAGSGKVFQHVPGNMDVHSYRAEYATALYLQVARPVESIPYDRVTKTGRRYQSGVYCCRGDRRGVKFDKAALEITSLALGHNRISILPAHYLRF